MRKIIAITQVSLDGVMQAPGGPDEDTASGFTHGGWAMPYVDDALNKVIDGIISSDFDMLLGRRTYDIFAAFWPKQGDSIGKAFDKATKYVVTHRPEGLPWANSKAIGGDVVEELRRIKASEERPLHLWGSATLLQTLIAAGLIDEYQLWVFPVVLGSGKRLFEKDVPASGLDLVATQRTPKGVLVNTYRPAGPLPENG